MHTYDLPPVQDIRLTSDTVTPTPSSDEDCAVCFSSSAECELVVLKCAETVGCCA